MGIGKRGELTTQQIVILIILIVSFIIILVFIFLLHPSELTNKEICHNSVVMKDKSSSLIGELDCKTGYVCISGGGECENFNPTTTKKIELKSDGRNKERVINATIEEMEECWWMFGEGKVNYIGKQLTYSKYCAICSIIVFDEEIEKYSKEEILPITYREIYEEMLKSRDNTQTHLNYLYNKNTLGSFEEDFYVEEYLDNQLEANKQYFILTGLSKTALGGFLDFTGIFGGGGPIPVTMLEKTRDNYDKIGCKEFVTKA